MSKQLALCRNDWQNCVDAWLQSQCVCTFGSMHDQNHHVMYFWFDKWLQSTVCMYFWYSRNI